MGIARHLHNELLLWEGGIVALLYVVAGVGGAEISCAHLLARQTSFRLRQSHFRRSVGAVYRSVADSVALPDVIPFLPFCSALVGVFGAAGDARSYCQPTFRQRWNAETMEVSNAVDVAVGHGRCRCGIVLRSDTHPSGAY